MINYLTLCQGSKVIREEHNTGLKPYPCHMPLLHKNLSVIVFWLTFIQPQLIGWLADWLEADLLTDLQHWLLCLPTYWPIDWLNGWLTGNNTSHKSLKQNPFFLNFLENFVHSLFSPLFSLKYAPLLPQCWATHILEHWDDCNTQIDIGEGENHTSVSRFVTSIVAHWLIDLTGWLTYWDSC